LSEVELLILQILEHDPKITVQNLSNTISKSLASTKRYLKNLTESQIIKRENGNRKGAWIILKK
jgi:Transcriptional regulators